MDILGVLQIIFIVLKLLGIITWSWWLVFSPILIYVAIVSLFLFIGFLGTHLGIYDMKIKRRKGKRNRH